MPPPHSDALFHRYFFPWYSEEDRKRRVYEATRPDMEEFHLSPNLLASDLSPLAIESQADVAERVADMLAAAAEDWKALLKVKGAPSLEWLAAFDRHFDSRRIQQVIARSEPDEYDNDYLVLCSELGAVLGTVLSQAEPGLSWLYDWPYWESGLYHPPSGARINVFHWAVKKMSSDAMDGLVPKVEACLEMLRNSG